MGTSCTYGVVFPRLLNEHLTIAAARFRRTVTVALSLLLAAVICLLKAYNAYWFWYVPILQVYSLIVSTLVFSRVLLSLIYREPKDRGFLPRVSLIIAVKNEEAHIAETVDHCFQTRYPTHLREVIVIDDGSTDRTWDVLRRLARRYPQMRLFRFGSHRGKRHAMALGAGAAKGEILIYLDSDSCVEPEAVYRIVQPFVDPAVGAVAGHILVMVEPDNFISKMESVRYFVAHRIIKASESFFNAVTCCSGAFSAYRRTAVLEVLPAWLNQTFLGIRSTFGDDRSLTNHILKRYRVIYHAGARSATYVPNTWSKFFRQQLRWKKSWTRETLVAATFMFRKHPIAAFLYYTSVALTLLSPLIVFRACVYVPLLTAASCLPYLGGLVLVYALMSLISFYYTQSSCWYYGLAFAVLHVGVLCWQNYYAIATVNRTQWGTR